jgi:WD40 repeat protein
VRSVAVSPDGSLVATGADGVRLYDARTGKLVRAIHDAGDRGIVFSPDGRTLAASGFHMRDVLSSPMTSIPLFDVQTGKRTLFLDGHKEWETYSYAFSPDGTQFASTGADKQIFLWALPSGKLLRRFGDPAGVVTAIAFSPDGKSLASGGADRVVRIWNASTGELQKSLRGHRDWICTLAFSPDGRSLASGCCDWAYHRGNNPDYFERPDPGCKGQWILWDIDSGQAMRNVQETGRLMALALAPDGASLVCGSANEVRVYDLRTNDPGRVLAKHGFDVTCLAFSMDGSAVISGGHDHAVKRTNLATGRLEWEIPGYHDIVNAVALSKDGSLLATASSDGRLAQRVLKAGDRLLDPGAVRLWNAHNSRLLRRLGDPSEQFLAVALSPDGRHVAGGGVNAKGEGIMRVWDAASGALVCKSSGTNKEVVAIAYAPDGKLLATGDAIGLLKLRDPATGEIKKALTGHAGTATSVAFSADGSLVVCGAGDGGAYVWETKSGRLLRVCKATDSKAATVTRDRLINAVALSSDGSTLVCCPATVGNSYTEPVRLWDLKTGELKRSLAIPVHSARPIALSPDGSILASGGKTIKLWDVRTGKQIRELFGYLKKTQAIVFSTDGKLIWSGGSYGTTNAWEVASGRHLITLFTFPATAKGAALDDWLAYGPDGYFDGSLGVEQYLAWRVGTDFLRPDTVGVQLHRPDLLESALRLQKTVVGSK